MGNVGGVNDTVTEHGNRVRDARGSVGGNRFFVRKDLPNFPRNNTSDLRSNFLFNFRRERIFRAVPQSARVC